MKVTPIDYLLSALVITVLCLSSLAAVMFVTTWTRALLGAYHVVADTALWMIGYGVLSAILLRGLLHWRPLAAGQFSETSPEFTQWKLLTVVHRLGQGALRPFTPVFLLPVVDALFGARIGSDVAFGGEINDPWLVEVGEGTTLGTHSIVTGSTTGGGLLTMAPVRLGKGVTVGPNVMISPGCEIGDGAKLMVGSYLMPNSRVPAGETWRGNPARKWVPVKTTAALVD
ncbi:MAG: hypothetical protein KBC73_02225 [Burkholderiaceae bacterium]|nr:hypothetical protein [Burkholderiaceae bacterium]